MKKTMCLCLSMFTLLCLGTDVGIVQPVSPSFEGKWMLVKVIEVPKGMGKKVFNQTITIKRTSGNTFTVTEVFNDSLKHTYAVTLKNGMLTRPDTEFHRNRTFRFLDSNNLAVSDETLFNDQTWRRYIDGYARISASKTKPRKQTRSK